MDSVLRAAALYLVLLVLFRIAGRRSLTDITTFDLLLLMIIGEATQQALLGDDFSLVNAVLVIITLIVIDVGLSLLAAPSEARHPDRGLADAHRRVRQAIARTPGRGPPARGRHSPGRPRDPGPGTHGADPLRHPREERQDLDHSRSRRLTLRAWRISSGWMLRPCTQMLRATRLSTRSLAVCASAVGSPWFSA